MVCTESETVVEFVCFVVLLPLFIVHLIGHQPSLSVFRYLRSLDCLLLRARGDGIHFVVLPFVATSAPHFVCLCLVV